MTKTTNFLTIKQAARFLGVADNTLRNWDAAGAIAVHRHPKNNYRLADTVEAGRELTSGGLRKLNKRELALKLEPIYAARAKAAQVEGGKKKVPQKSGEPKKGNETSRQLAKLAGVSHDTIAKAKLAEVYEAGPKAKGTRGQLKSAGPGRGKTGSTKTEPPVSDVPTLADLGINKKKIFRP
ncbi:MAG: MerR family DNA-binding transcriptional regulator [Pirellulales bacterium]|nr:MerR family DNA-binding transcriptional regulator [Pirellulales bacterium]